MSSENTKRPSVSVIFEILTDEYKNFFEDFDVKNDVKIKIIGEKKGLPHNVRNILSNIENQTKENNKLNLNIAFNYGTNKELLSMINNIVDLHKNKKVIINENLLQEQMYLPNVPDPDLLIRTGGFQRLSNFLLLKLSYTELFFTQTLWPNLTKKEILKIIESFYSIERKYGL